MPEQSWKKAIITVLRESKDPLHYQEITERILSRGLKSTAGATPAATVNAQIAASIKHEGAASPYVRVAKGLFALRERAAQPETEAGVEAEASEGIIRAFGMYWRRDRVKWKRQPQLFGCYQEGAANVDFGDQRGVYVLYDHLSAVYVGRATDRPLSQRLYEHTLDRLSGRWDRFSWFGLRGVSDRGELIDGPSAPSETLLVATLEALLIEALEPPQNRRRGDDFTAIEYIQATDPKLETEKLLQTIKEKLQQSQ